MNSIYKLSMLIVMLCWKTAMASADALPLAAPLETIVARSDFIVIGKLIKVVKNPAAKPSPLEPARMITRGGGFYLTEPGKYQFKVLHTVKGMPPAEMTVTLPAIDSRVYNWTEPIITVGVNVLLFVKRSRGLTNIDLLPTDPILPLAVLPNSDNRSNAYDLQKGENSPPALQQVCSILLDSIGDKQLLQANTYLLKDVVDPQIPKKLMPFIDDPDEKVQSGVLACLASNQVVEAIPRIAHLHAKLQVANSGSGCIEKLEDYRVKEAVPYLNVLLFNPYTEVRFCASMALRKAADTTSIPYLISGLSDPDKTNQYECYATLTRLIPQLGAQKTIDEFDKNPKGIVLPYLNWWHEELDGGHRPLHPLSLS